MINIQEGKIIPIYPNNEKYYRYRRITEDGLNMNIIKFWNEHINRKLKQAERLNKCKS